MTTKIVKSPLELIADAQLKVHKAERRDARMYARHQGALARFNAYQDRAKVNGVLPISDQDKNGASHADNLALAESKAGKSAQAAETSLNSARVSLAKRSGRAAEASMTKEEKKAKAKAERAAFNAWKAAQSKAA